MLRLRTFDLTLPARPTLRAIGLFSTAIALGCDAKVDGPALSVTGVSPQVVCVSQSGTTVTITGSGLSPVLTGALAGAPKLALPRVTIQRVEDLTGKATDPMVDKPIVLADDPAHPELARTKSVSDTQLEFLATSDMVPGVYSLQLLSPSTDVKQASIDKALLVVPPPAIKKLTAPMACSATADQDVRFTGENFVCVGGQPCTGQPMVLMRPMAGGADKTYSVDLNQCTDLPVDTNPPLMLALCKEGSFHIKKGELPVTGDYAMTLTNPPPADCAKTSPPSKYTVLPPPTVTSVKPMNVCGDGGTLVITGTDFSLAKDAMGRSLVRVMLSNGQLGTISKISATSITAAFIGMYLVGTKYDLQVMNPDGCTGSLPMAVNTLGGPDLAFVDTPVVGIHINTPIAIQVRALSGMVKSVTLTQAAMTKPMSANLDPNHANRILAVVPSGLAPGTWDVTVADTGTGCGTKLVGAIKAVDMGGPDITVLDHPIGIANTAQPELLTGTGFAAVPRLYLTTGGGATAIAIGAVTFNSAVSLGATFPALPIGSYDLAVVNPDGTSKVVSKAYTVNALPLPRIDSLSTPVVDKTNMAPIFINGANFRSGAKPVAVALACSDMAMHNVAVLSSGPSTIKITAPDFSGSPVGTTCTVRVTNGDDGSFADYASLGVSGPMGAAVGSRGAPDLGNARRAPAVGAITPASGRHVLVAAGGDAGNAAAVFDSVETLAIDGSGPNPLNGSWATQAGKLAKPTTLAGAAAIGRYFYVIGGNDGKTAVATVQRAMLLDPSQAPVITEAYMEPAGGMGGLAAGYYSFRVSAKAAANDVDNPGGESIASDPMMVYVPTVMGNVKVTLTWKPVMGATGYFVYRSAMGDGGSEQLVSAVGPNATTYTDTGAMPMVNTPLLVGSLGTWATLVSLGTARESPAVTFAADPMNANAIYVYALGGKDAMGAALASYEVLDIAVGAAGKHTVGSWTPGTNPLASARWQAGAWAVATMNATYVYVGGGTTGMATVASVEVGSVGAKGDLGAFASAGATVNAFGFAAVVAGGSLFTAGDDAVDTNIQMSTISMMPPALSAFAAGGMLFKARYLPGAAVDGASLFVVGGSDKNKNGASKSTEWMVY